MLLISGLYFKITQIDRNCKYCLRQEFRPECVEEVVRRRGGLFGEEGGEDKDKCGGK